MKKKIPQGQPKKSSFLVQPVAVIVASRAAVNSSFFNSFVSFGREILSIFGEKE